MMNALKLEEGSDTQRSHPHQTPSKRVLCLKIVQNKIICLTVFFFTIITLINFVTNLVSDQAWKEILLDAYNSTMKINRL